MLIPALPCLLIVALLPLSLPAADAPISEAELVHRTQALFDAVAIGDKAPWDKAFADDCLFFDEKGRKMDKKALLEDIAPLPPGYFGTIKLVRPQSRIVGDTAILSYDLDETETVFGQAMTARYHGTDTWMRRHGEWQIIASQALRYYEDPPAGTPAPNKLPDYVGTYSLAGKRTMRIVAENGKLFYVRDGSPPDELVIESGDIFFRRGVEGRSVFRRDAAGKVDAYISRRNNEDIVWERVN